MNILTFIQIAIAFFLIVVVMLQNRGNTSGTAFGTSATSYRSKKGIEKLLFYATIGLAILFACISILAVLI